jgi:hypothetical protein
MSKAFLAYIIIIIIIVIIIIIIYACPILAKEQYIMRHDRVCVQLHFNICKEVGIKLDNKGLCEHVPKSIETDHEGKITILCNQDVQTDRNILNNKPDVIVCNTEKATCKLIEVAIS